MDHDLPQLGTDGRILEGIVTTRNEDGTVNISPMGPIVDEQLQRFLFRPYQTSTTYKNLKREGTGVFHVTDDVLLFAQAAVGQPEPMPAMDDLILVDACRWLKFEVRTLDDSQARTEISAETIGRGTHREFFGFNRAKHAVLEAAILATRVHLLPAEEIRQEIKRLESPIHKTAGEREIQAFTFLQTYINNAIAREAMERSNQ